MPDNSQNRSSDDQATTTKTQSNFALWNARSIRPKISIICELVLSNNLDILAITESWLTGDYRQDHALADLALHLPNYTLHHIPRENRTGGGVCVLLRTSYNVTTASVTPFKSFEYMEITVTSRRHVTLRLVVLYRPQRFKNKKPTAPTFFLEFSSFLEHIESVPGGHLLITGDFNFHVNVPGDREALKFRDIADSANLKQHVDRPTHISGNTLDLILTRASDNIVSNITTTSYLPSDHAAVLCSLNIVRPKPTRMTITTRKLRNIDIDAFRNDILTSSLYTSLNYDLESLIREYDRVLQDLKDKHAPEITRTVKCRPNAPWFTDKLHDKKT